MKGSMPESATRPPGVSVVQVIITTEHFAVMDPPVPFLLPMLEYHRRTFVLEGPTGYREVKEAVRLWDLDIKGRLAFPAGLLPRLRRALEERGHHVRVEDRRKQGP